jgi:hypothetical protein
MGDGWAHPFHLAQIYFLKKAISKRKINRRKKKIFGDKKTSKRILQPSQRFFRGLF